MKKNKLLLYVLCIILIFVLCSCGFFGKKRYVCEIDKVESIQIIRLDKYIENEYRFDYTVLSQISDIETFVKRLNEVEHNVNWGDPGVMNVQFVVIKINYYNGDYDLLHPDAQMFNQSGKFNTGFFFFDDEQFNLLISDYLKK